MIFQINYETDRYDKYFEHNKELLKYSYHIFDTDGVNKFLDQFGYRKRFEALKVKPGCEHAKTAILLDAFRLMVLYELGGLYIDADVKFTDKITHLEYDLWNHFQDRNVVLRTKSMFFIKGIKDSRFIESLLWRYLNADQLDYDVKMLGKWNLHDFGQDLAIIEPSFLKPYFTHDKVTTK